jgi:hypothetical protein
MASEEKPELLGGYISALSGILLSCLLFEAPTYVVRGISTICFPYHREY